jgi:hypothetical protein
VPLSPGNYAPIPERSFVPARTVAADTFKKNAVSFSFSFFICTFAQNFNKTKLTLENEKKS